MNKMISCNNYVVKLWLMVVENYDQ